MVPNTGIKASSPRDETHPQNMTGCKEYNEGIKQV